VEKKQQELLYARTTTVNISRVDIDIGSSWQYTNSTFSPSVTVVKVENHLGKIFSAKFAVRIHNDN